MPDQAQDTKEQYRIGLDAASLKMFAVITMLIDHCAATLLYNRVLHPNAPIARDSSLFQVYQVYKLLRGIGRLSFPIFCFFLVQGFLYTRSRQKYALRLLIFGILSELPFDLAFFETPIYLKHQNVMFELLAGLLMLWCFEMIEKKLGQTNFLSILLRFGSAAAFAALTYVCHLDYSYKGMILILVLYLLRFDRKLQCLGGAAAIGFWSWPAALAFIPLYFYNGKRGRQTRYFFYAFYPVHLILLAVLERFI